MYRMMADMHGVEVEQIILYILNVIMRYISILVLRPIFRM